MHSPAHDHGAGQFEHRALVYDDIPTVVDEVARVVTTDLQHDRAVLVCVAEPIAAQVEQRVAAHERLHFLDLSDRYTRPVDAMDVLWRFTNEQLSAGALRVHSVGELTFTGTPSDDDWFWYEAACNDVLDDLALTATCLYGTHRCPESAIAMVRATHEVVELGDARLPAVDTAPPPNIAAPSMPNRSPDVEFVALSAAAPRPRGATPDRQHRPGCHQPSERRLH